MTDEDYKNVPAFTVLDHEHPAHWSQAYAEYDGTACSNCKRYRVLHYPAVGRRVCEKCNWDNSTGDWAYDHERIG